MSSMALRAGILRRQKPSSEAEQKHQADVALAAQRAELLDAARKAESRLRQAQARQAPVAEIRRLAKDLDAGLTAAMQAAYAAQRAEIGPRGYDDRIYRRKARAKPGSTLSRPKRSACSRCAKPTVLTASLPSRSSQVH